MAAIPHPAQGTRDTRHGGSRVGSEHFLVSFKQTIYLALSLQNLSFLLAIFNDWLAASLALQESVSRTAREFTHEAELCFSHALPPVSDFHTQICVIFIKRKE